MRVWIFLLLIVADASSQTVYRRSGRAGARAAGAGCGSTVVYGTTATAGRGLNVSSQTFSMVVNSGTCLLLVVGITHSGPFSVTTVSTVVFNTTESLTFLTGSGQTNSGTRTEIWYLKAPTATTANIVVTMSASTSVVISGAVAVSDAHQTSTFGTPTLATGTSTAPAATCTSAAGDLVFGVCGVDNASTRTLTSNLGNQRWITTVSATQEGGGSTRAGATPALSWTIDVSDVWAVSTVSIHHN